MILLSYFGYSSASTIKISKGIACVFGYTLSLAYLFFSMVGIYNMDYLAVLVCFIGYFQILPDLFLQFITEKRIYEDECGKAGNYAKGGLPSQRRILTCFAILVLALIAGCISYCSNHNYNTAISIVCGLCFIAVWLNQCVDITVSLFDAKVLVKTI